MNEDEVRVALPVLQTETIADGVHERLRLLRLPQVVAHVGGILQRRLKGDDGCDVDAVDANRPANRRQRVGCTDERADAQAREPVGLRKRPPDDDVRKGRQRRNEARAREVRVRLVHEDDRFPWDARRNDLDRRHRHRHPGRVVRVRQEDHPGMAGDRGEHLVERKGEVGPRRDVHRTAAGDRRVDLENLEGRLWHDGLGNLAAGQRPQAGDRDGENALVEAVGQRNAGRRHAQMTRALVHDRLVGRIEGDLIGPE